MQFNKDKIIKELGLVPFGQRGWLRAKNMTCPDCGKSDKFGIILGEKHSTAHCFYGGFTESLFKYLIRIDRKDLLEYSVDVDITEKLTGLTTEQEELDYSMPEKRLPIGYHRIMNDKYLYNRGFIEYLRYEVGMTGIDPIYKNRYLLFPIREHDDMCVGFIARSKESKKWHEANLQSYKEGKCDLLLRYKNSPDTDFSKYLYGINDVTENTETVILVEGIFSKFSIDRKLCLYHDESVRCCAMFGQSVSEWQIKRLLDKSIGSVILMFDQDAVDSIKKCGLMLSNHFETRIAYINKVGCDPDDLTCEELVNIMNDLKDPMSFNVSKITNKLR